MTRDPEEGGPHELGISDSLSCARAVSLSHRPKHKNGSPEKESPLMSFYRDMKDNSPASFAKELREMEKAWGVVKAAQGVTVEGGQTVNGKGDEGTAKCVDLCEKLIAEILAKEKK